MADMANFCTFVPAEPGPSAGPADDAIDEMKAVLDNVGQTTEIYDVKRILSEFVRICKQHDHPFGREVDRFTLLSKCKFCRAHLGWAAGPRRKPRPESPPSINDRYR